MLTRLMCNANEAVSWSGWKLCDGTLETSEVLLRVRGSDLALACIGFVVANRELQARGHI